MTIQQAVSGKRAHHPLRAAAGYVLGAIGGVCALLILMGTSWWYNAVTDLGVRAVDKGNWMPFRAYTPEIERALGLLSTVRPDQYEYIKRNGVPIQQLPTTKFNDFGCNARTAYGCTNLDLGAIAINETQKEDAIFQAAIISHELVHIQHGDSSHELGGHSARYHFFLRYPEAEAHLTGNWTLLRLSRGTRPTFKNCVDMWGRFIFELVVYALPFLLVILSLASGVLLLYGFWKILPKIRERRPFPLRV